MTGDPDTARIVRLVFARNFVLGRPQALGQAGAAGVAIDMNGLVRAIQLVSETDSDVEQDTPGRWLCYKWGDVANVVATQLSALFTELDARCLVLAFDHFTPLAKRPVQDKRRDAASGRKMLNNREPYQFPPPDERRLDAWFNDDLDVGATWSEVFYNPVARLRVQEYLVRSLIERYRMPVGTSVIIEGAVLDGAVRQYPLEIACRAAGRVEVRERIDVAPRHTYSEADIRVVHWAQWLAERSADGQPVVVEERDADVLNALLLLEHSRVQSGAPGATIYMKRTRSVWDPARSRNVKVPEYVHIGGLYLDIALLFGALMTRMQPAAYHTEPIDLFMSLVLMRGDDYCATLAYCTAMTLWSALFVDAARVVPWVDSAPRPEGTPVATPARIALHYTAARNFVDLAYEFLERERKGKQAAAAAARAAAKPDAPSCRKRAPAKPAAKKPPRGWPDRAELQILLARQCWQLDVLANAHRPGCHVENELRRDDATPPLPSSSAAALSSSSSSSSSGAAAGGTVSFYGWERGVDGRICYAPRVADREVFVVERPHDPVVLRHATPPAAPCHAPCSPTAPDDNNRDYDPRASPTAPDDDDGPLYMC